MIVAQHPTPIVVISSTVSSESVQATFPILESGALSALEKPSNAFSPTFEHTRKEIVETIRAMAEIKVVKRRLKSVPDADTVTGISHRLSPLAKVNYEVIAIGVSVGGPQALKTIFSKLPANFPLPIVLVQHMSYGFINGYADWLSAYTPLVVQNGKHLEQIKKGHIYVAPDNCHMTVDRINGRLYTKLLTGQPVDGFYPSITVLLESVAKVCGNKAIGGLLTGMGFDGAKGLLEMKKKHAFTFIQDKESAVVFGMAKVAESLGAVDEVIRLNQIASYLEKLVEGM
jgi:two-component system chemotaxis response regulator CheB